MLPALAPNANLIAPVERSPGNPPDMRVPSDVPRPRDATLLSPLQGKDPFLNSRFVLISRCSGGGKSTLLAELRARGYPVVEEPGRRIIAEGSPREIVSASGSKTAPYLSAYLTAAQPKA